MRMEHHRKPQRRLSTITAAFFCLAITAFFASTSWSQSPEAGPATAAIDNDEPQLADTWLPQGPKRLWHRVFSGSFTGIAFGGDLAYVIQYGITNTERTEATDGITALVPKTGMTQWAARFPALVYEEQRLDTAPMSQSWPQFAGETVIAATCTGTLYSLSADSGRITWRQDLYADFGGKVQESGYSARPLLYKNLVIVLVGGRAYGVVAFDLETGSTVWTSPRLDISYASPILINVGGQDQVVFLSSNEVLGLDANTGKLLWRRDHASKNKHNWSTPVWGNDNLLFVSSTAPAGSRVFRLTLKDGKTKIDELWHNPKAGIRHANAIRVDDHIYGCFTEGSSDYFAAVNVKTGKFAWKEPGFPQANFAYSSGKIFLLDKDGTFSLATVSPKKLTLHASARVLEKALGAMPIVAGTTLYIRNGQGLFAYDVSPDTLVDNPRRHRQRSRPPSGGATDPKEKRP